MPVIFTFIYLVVSAYALYNVVTEEAAY